ncbi:MAG: sigma 54-interacting transcriptional regulator [Gemmatimonadales bacterium]|nr:sigma 54-interacting transcriptional regulator [Gemmatimonadales bacterium]
MHSGNIVYASRVMQRVLELVDRFAPTPTPVLLLGPTGAGKEVLAHRVHELSGRRGPLIDVNCAAIPSDLVEGELFGSRKGSFTGAVQEREGLIAAADGGTLFLDELTSLAPPAQAKLLRALETHEIRQVGAVGKRQVDFRLVAAALDDLQPAVSRGAFRLDLLQRASGVVIEVPALATRMDDVVPLARHFAARRGRTLRTSAESCLLTYHWPGNVRELRTAVERAGILCDEVALPAVAIVEAISLGGVRKTPFAPVARLVEVCRANGWQAGAAAQALGISRATLFRRLKAAGVSLRGDGRLPGRAAGAGDAGGTDAEPSSVQASQQA